MSKIDDILDELDSGGDFDVKWSARTGDRVLLVYEDGTKVVVEAKLATLEVTPKPDVSETSER